ncbi:MAG: class I SAM-dependent methyltransferase [Acidobacteriota bacterium]|nr:class I SAM-dependent methyltransferase [Acidobacteriota bacterium]
MKSRTFGETYAAAYDHLYSQKDYAIECDLVEMCFDRYLGARPESLLDLGCGTGGHARLLASRGYRITAVDQSREMLEIARAKSASKAASSQGSVQWICADISAMGLGETFDAALLMFAVIGYFTTDEDVIRAFANIRRHLREGGLLCFDFWYGPAVLAIGPSDRTATLSTPQGPLTRRSTSTLFPAQQTCHVRYEMEGPTQSSISEVHAVRYFSASDIQSSLQAAGFELLSLTAFPSLDQPLDESAWSAFCVARAT